MYPLIQNRKFQQIDVLENLNLVLSISGKKNKLRCYYLSYLKSKFITNQRGSQSENQNPAEKQGFTAIGDVEGRVKNKIPHMPNFRPKIKILEKNRQKSKSVFFMFGEIEFWVKHRNSVQKSKFWRKIELLINNGNSDKSM